MKKYRGSFTVEAAYIVPLILFCICIAIEAGILLHNEVKTQAVSQMEKKTENMIACMYRKELVKELLGDLYED